MSNIDRSRTDYKACSFCTSTDRDSNGQCHCRNILYRISAQQSVADKATLAKAFNAAVKKGKTVEEARDAARAKVPALKSKQVATKKAVAKKAAVKKAAPKARRGAKKAPTVAPLALVMDADPEVIPDPREATEVPTEVEVALPVAEEDFEFVPEDEVEHAAVQEDGGWHCACGFRGKGTGPSVRAHVSRENRVA